MKTRWERCVFVLLMLLPGAWLLSATLQPADTAVSAPVKPAGPSSVRVVTQGTAKGLGTSCAEQILLPAFITQAGTGSVGQKTNGSGTSDSEAKGKE